MRFTFPYSFFPLTYVFSSASRACYATYYSRLYSSRLGPTNFYLGYAKFDKPTKACFIFVITRVFIGNGLNFSSFFFFTLCKIESFDKYLNVWRVTRYRLFKTRGRSFFLRARVFKNIEFSIRLPKNRFQRNYIFNVKIDDKYRYLRGMLRARRIFI